MKSCLVKGDTKDYQVSCRISLEIPLSDFSMASQNVLIKDYQRLLKIMWITTFKLSLLCHCIIQETNWAHFHAFREEACSFHTTGSVTFQTERASKHVQRSSVSNAITDFTNSAKGKVKHNFIALRTKNRHRPPTWDIHLLNYPLLILQSLSHLRPHLTLLYQPPERLCH